MAIARVQQPTTGGAGTSRTITWSPGPVNGNFLVMVIAIGNTTTLVTGIAQTGATWNQIIRKVGTSDAVEIWAAYSVSGAATTSVISFDGSVRSAECAAEYSGISSSPLDKTASNSGNGTTFDSGTTATTTQASELFISGFAFHGASQTVTNGAGFTKVAQGNSGASITNACLEEDIVSATGTAHDTPTVPTTAVDWAGVVATFKAAVPLNVSVNDSIAVSEFVKVRRVISVTGLMNPDNAYNDTSIGTTAWFPSLGTLASDWGRLGDGDGVDLSITPGEISNLLSGLDFTYPSRPAIPSPAIVRGVEFDIHRTLGGGSANVVDNTIMLFKNGTVQGDNKALGTNWGLDEIKSYGGSNDTWGLTLTPSDINDGRFGIGVAIQKDSSANPRTAYTSTPTFTIFFTDENALGVNEVDNVTVAEAVTISIPRLQVSVSDSVAVAETVVIDVQLNPVVSDSVVVAEDVTVQVSAGGPQLSVFDSVTVVEDVTIDVQLNPVVSDSVTVAEDVTVSIPYLQVVVSDSVSIAESVQLDLTLEPSVFDSVAVAEDVVVDVQLDPSVSDSVTVAEDVVVSIPFLQLSVFDSATVAEDVQLNLEVQPQVSDSVTVAEDVRLSLELQPSVFDSVTVAEDVQLNLELQPQVSDAVTVTEDVVVSVPSLQVVVSDSVTVAESVAVSIPFLQLSVDDAVAVTEEVTALVAVPSSFLAVDDITVTESVTILIAQLNLAVSDSITVAEDVQLDLKLEPTVFDSVSVAESVQLDLTLEPLVVDSVTVAEAVAVKIPFLQLSVSDSVSVAESVTVDVQLNPAVSDSITVTEDVVVSIPFLRIVVSDLVSVTESVTAAVPTLQLSVLDSVSVAETVVIDVRLNPIVSDSVTVAEDVAVSVQLNPIVSDSVTVAENVSVTIPTLQVNVSDSVTVAEAVQTFVGQGTLRIDVSDDVVVTENVAMKMDLGVSVTDDVGVAEDIAIYLPLHAIVSDDVVTTDFAELALSALFASVTDSITVEEYVNLIAFQRFYLIDVFDTVNVAEAITVSPTVGILKLASAGVLVSTLRDTDTTVIPSWITNTGVRESYLKDSDVEITDPDDWL